MKSATISIKSCCLTDIDSRALAGEFGARAQRAAEAKMQAWSEIYDDRAVTICAGHVRRPGEKHDHSATPR